VLPENFPQMGRHESDKLAIAEQKNNGLIQTRLSNFAQEHQVWIVAGTIPLQHDAQHVYAHVPVYSPSGECVASYNKLHLFDVAVPETGEQYFESRSIAPGDHWQTVQIEQACVGLSVCYDLRFPELYRKLAQQGANVFVVPAAFTATTGKAHWLTLLRARAIENQCFVIAPNQGGQHENGRATYGHSVIIDPWGEVLAQAELGEQVICADLNFAEQQQLRARFPVLDHARLSIADRINAAGAR
jgi:nitrilase